MLTAFTAGLLLITVSELGDKTFFIAMCLATQHSRRWVLLGAVLALAAIAAVNQSEVNLKKKTPFAIVLEAFLLTFVAE